SPKDQLECENKYKILKLYKTNASLGGGGINDLNQRNISINYFFYGSSPKDQLECENKYKILKLYKTNASLGGGGINDL
ncbi:hypothetical protein IFO25_09965, partial [Campylobacter coli]|nr:hypothetical protein [Campylobacter coli]